MKLSEKMDTHKSYQLFINIISYFFLANQLHTSNCLSASFIFSATVTLKGYILFLLSKSAKPTRW